jgi:hypothetical protein
MAIYRVPIVGKSLAFDVQVDDQSLPIRRSDGQQAAHSGNKPIEEWIMAASSWSSTSAEVRVLPNVGRPTFNLSCGLPHEKRMKEAENMKVS